MISTERPELAEFPVSRPIHDAVGAAPVAAIAEPVEDARSYVKKQPIKHADETGWREGIGRSRAWLWTVVTTQVVVFMIGCRSATDVSARSFC